MGLLLTGLIIKRKELKAETSKLKGKIRIFACSKINFPSIAYLY
jgi:hypothetical protein